MPKPAAKNTSYIEYHRKKNAGLRLSDDGLELLKLLANHHGIGKADVVEMLIRERCRKEGIEL